MGDDFDEHRAWQQLTCSKQLCSVKLAARSRLEQRSVETGDDVGWRFRQFFRAQRTLCSDSRVMFVTWDEMFFHLNDTDWGAADGFDQNRLFVGLGLQRHEDSQFRVEVGYFHQFVNRSTADDLSNHILAVNIFRNPK